MKFDRITCRYNLYCISISQTQARLNQLTNILGDRNYTMIATNTYGLQSGNLQPTLCRGIHATGYQIFKVTVNLGGWFTCGELYSEGLIRIGSFTGGTAVDGSITLENRNLSFYDDSVTGVLPPALIDLSTGVSVELRNCGLAGRRIQTLIHSPSATYNSLTVSGGSWGGAVNISNSLGGFTDPGLMQAATFSGGSFLGSPYLGEAVPSGPGPHVNWLNPTLTLFGSMGRYPLTWSPSIQFMQSVKGMSDYEGVQADLFKVPTWQPQKFSSPPDNFVTTAATISSCDVMSFGYDVNSSQYQGGRP
jgi:hypothetical protein